MSQFDQSSCSLGGSWPEWSPCSSFWSLSLNGTWPTPCKLCVLNVALEVVYSWPTAAISSQYELDTMASSPVIQHGCHVSVWWLPCDHAAGQASSHTSLMYGGILATQQAVEMLR